MKILLTGGAGFIGSSLVEMTVAQGWDVTVLDALTYAGHVENLESIPQSPGRWNLIEADLRDAARVAQIIQDGKFDAVLNLAAESHVDRSITGPSAFIETNILGVFNLLRSSLDYWKSLDESAQKKFRYLQVSTDEVYGSLGPTGKFSETTPMAPNSPYSASKASGDLLTRAWFHTYGLPTITTNCSNNYGPRQFPEKLIPHMIHCALTDRPLPVYGDGANVRDWIHVKDHCQGILLALEKGKPGETYCFGGDAERDNLKVVRAICEILDRHAPKKNGKKHSDSIQFVTDRPGHDRRYAIDDSRAMKELGFRRNFQFESGLEDTVLWYLNHGAWREAVLKSKAQKGKVG
ncbi:MAG: dTDP-glucose 4,6-dehydratase [Bdellovibrionales bacterium]|nr:dTDP-glucose 4,6-dehydratase [Bdellovibrionales bacterium]